MTQLSVIYSLALKSGRTAVASVRFQNLWEYIKQKVTSIRDLCVYKIFGRPGGIDCSWTFSFKVILLTIYETYTTGNSYCSWFSSLQQPLTPHTQDTDNYPPRCHVETLGSLTAVRTYLSAATTAREWSLPHFWFLDLIQVCLTDRT